MTQPEASPHPLQRELLRLFVEYNPLYLLSAGCMLAGCYVLATVLAPEPGRLAGLLGLLTVQNVYEGLLLSSGLYLVTHRNLPRDARTLLLLQAAFLFDATHLYAEGAADPDWGTLVAGLALMIGLAKIRVVQRALRIELAAPLLALIVTGYAAQIVLPGTLAALVRRGLAVDGLMAASWWGLGLLLLAYSFALPAAADDTPATDTGAGPRPDRAFRGALLVLPPVSLVLHLWALSWLYDAPFFFSHLTPVGLALSLCAVRAQPSWFPRTRVLLPTVSVFFSLVSRPTGYESMPLTPLMAAGLLAGLIHLHDARRNGGGAAALLAGLYLGVAPIVRFWDDWVLFASRFVPSTGEEWGRLGVAGAFVLLGLGLAVSLYKSRPLSTPTRSEG